MMSYLISIYFPILFFLILSQNCLCIFIGVSVPKTSSVMLRFALSMMMSSNGNIFRVTGLLWWESTGPVDSHHKGRWRFDVSLICAWTNGWANNKHRWFETPSHSLWRHCNSVTVFSWPNGKLIGEIGHVPLMDVSIIYHVKATWYLVMLYMRQ